MLASEAMPRGSSLYVKISGDTRFLLGNRIHAIHTHLKKKQVINTFQQHDDCSKQRQSPGINNKLWQGQAVTLGYN